MKLDLDVQKNDIIERKTVKALLCGLLEHYGVTLFERSAHIISSGRYEITITDTGIKIEDNGAPGLISHDIAYTHIDRIGLEFINERSGALGLYIELVDGSCMIIPDESGIEIKDKVLDMVNYASKAVSLSNKLFCNEEEEW